MSAVRNILALFIAMLLSACAIQLMPDYDQALIDGLEKANTEALTLFASVDEGSAKPEFGKYESSYASLIGQFEALRQRAHARYVPPLAKRLSKNQVLQFACDSPGAGAEACINRAPEHLTTVIDELRVMRSEHKTNGLPAGIVKGFKDRCNAAIRRLLVLESALKR